MSSLKSRTLDFSTDITPQKFLIDVIYQVN